MTRRLAWWTHIAAALREAARGEADVAEVLDELRVELGFDAALVIVPDGPGTHGRPLVNLGYPEDVADYLGGHYIDACPGYAWANLEQSPTRFIDLPFDFRSTPSFVDVLGPAGFDEGITIPFRVPFSGGDGFLAMSSRSSAPLDEDSRLALALLAGTLGAISVPESSFGPTWQPASHLLRVDAAGLRSITSDPLPRFVSEANLIALAGSLNPSRTALGLRGHSAEDWWRLNLYLARDTAGLHCAMIRISPAPHPHGLTERELDIVGAVRAGLDNNAVAALLGISVRTVKTHLERVTARLNTGNRTALAAAAWAEDLSTIAVELKLARPRP